MAEIKTPFGMVVGLILNQHPSSEKVLEEKITALEAELENKADKKKK